MADRCCAELLIERLHFEPGDVLVVWTDTPVKPETAERIREHIKRLTPAGVPVIVAARGISIELIARAVLEGAAK